MTYHDSPAHRIETPFGPVTLRAHGYGSAFVDGSGGDGPVTINGVEYSASLHIKPAGTYRKAASVKYAHDHDGNIRSLADRLRYAPWSERASHTSTDGWWEANSYADMYISRKDYNGDPSESARKKWAQGALDAAAAFLATEEGAEFLREGATAHGINEANRQAEKIREHEAAISEHRAELRKLARKGYRPDARA